MKKIKFLILILFATILTSCCCGKYDNLNCYIGSKVLDTIPCVANKGTSNEYNYYKYKINYKSDDGKMKFKTLNIRVEDHYWSPGDIISFEDEFSKIKLKSKENKNKNNFVE